MNSIQNFHSNSVCCPSCRNRAGLFKIGEVTSTHWCLMVVMNHGGDGFSLTLVSVMNLKNESGGFSATGSLSNGCNLIHAFRERNAIFSIGTWSCIFRFVIGFQLEFF